MADRWDKERLEKKIAELEAERIRYNETSSAMNIKMSEMEEVESEWRSALSEHHQCIKDQERAKREYAARNFIKSTTVHFNEVWAGRKKMEARKADRPYYIGECQLLQEFDPNTAVYSGREILVRITNIITGAEYGIIPGFVVFSFEVVSTKPGGELSDQIEQNRFDRENKSIVEAMSYGEKKAVNERPAVS